MSVRVSRRVIFFVLFLFLFQCFPAELMAAMEPKVTTNAATQINQNSAVLDEIVNENGGETIGDSNKTNLWGNGEPLSVTAAVDCVVKLTSPGNGTTYKVGASIPVKATASGVKYVQIYYKNVNNASDWGQIGPTYTDQSTCTTSWLTEGKAPGQYRIKVQGVNVPNEPPLTEDEVIINLEKTDCVVKLTSPGNGTTYKVGASIPVKATASGVKYVQIYYKNVNNASDWGQIGPTYTDQSTCTTSWLTEGKAPGQYRIKVQGVNVPNEPPLTEDEVIINLEKTDCVVKLTSPGNGTTYKVGASIPVKATASGVKYVQIYYKNMANASDWGQIGPTYTDQSTCTTSWLTEGKAPGQYRIKVQGVNVPNEPPLTEDEVIINLEKSDCVVKLTSPGNGTTYKVGASIPVKATASGVKYVQIYYKNMANSSDWGQIGPTYVDQSTCTTSWLTEGKAPGQYRIKVQGVNVPNEAPLTEDEVIINLEASDCLVQLTSPSDGATYAVGENITVNVRARGVKYTQIYYKNLANPNDWDQIGPTYIDQTECTATWNTTGKTPGSYRVKVQGLNIPNQTPDTVHEIIITLELRAESPKIKSTYPDKDDTNVTIGQNILIHFNKKLQYASYDSNNVKITDASGNNVPFIRGLGDGTVLTIIPQNGLAYNTSYTVTIPNQFLKDDEGNYLPSYSFSFTTRNKPNDGSVKWTYAKAVRIDDKYAVSYSNGQFSETWVGGTRAWRTNNPGNMVYGNHCKTYGAIGKDFGGQAIFPDYAAGFNSMVQRLRELCEQNKTINDTIYIWAPPTENNTEEYLNFLEKQTGYSRYCKLTTIDINKLANAIKKYEGYISGYIIQGESTEQKQVEIIVPNGEIIRGKLVDLRVNVPVNTQVEKIIFAVDGVNQKPATISQQSNQIKFAWDTNKVQSGKHNLNVEVQFIDGSSGKATSTVNIVDAELKYDRDKAKEYANTYWKKTCDDGIFYRVNSKGEVYNGAFDEIHGVDCAHFVSRALFNAYLMGNPSNKGNYKRGWASCDVLHNYLVKYEKAQKVPNLTDLQIGDLVFWYKTLSKGQRDYTHVGIITTTNSDGSAKGFSAHTRSRSGNTPKGYKNKDGLYIDVEYLRIPSYQQRLSTQAVVDDTVQIYPVEEDIPYDDGYQDEESNWDGVYDDFTPVVTINNPNAGDSFIVTKGQTVDFNATAISDTVITSMLLYINGELKYQTSNKDLSFNWSTDGIEEGVYIIEIDAEDANCKVGRQTTTVTIVAPLELPSVQINAPLSINANETMQIEAYAFPNSGNVSITNVCMYVNDEQKTAVDGPGLIYSWDTSGLNPGEYVIRVMATDEYGNVGENSTTITIIGDGLAEWTDFITNRQKSVNDPWIIKFSLGVDFGSVTYSNIFVATDEAGINKISGISLSTVPGDTSQTQVLVMPPSNGWQPETTYYLFISKNVRSSAATGNKELGKGIRMRFNVDNTPNYGVMAAVTSVPYVNIGGQNQRAGDIVLTETRPGSIIPGRYMEFTLPPGVNFASLPAVTVTSGDIYLDTAGMALYDQNRILRIPVLSLSSIESSRIIISNIQLNIDNTVPQGDIVLWISGTATGDVGQVPIATVPGT